MRSTKGRLANFWKCIKRFYIRLQDRYYGSVSDI